MWVRIAHRGLCAAIAAAIALAEPSVAGGAWPRGKDKVFASLSYSTSGELPGYVQALAARTPGIEPPAMTQEFGLYVEYGLTETLTFGIDRHLRPEENTAAGVWFLRRNFTRPGWRSSYGVEFGAGGYRDWRQVDDTQFRIGLSWGRGFEGGRLKGWVDVDAKLSTMLTTDSVAWKVDSTVGIEPSERSLLYLQMQSGALDGYPTYTRAQPTYVLRMGHGISLESALLIGIENDEAYGMKVGAWVEF